MLKYQDFFWFRILLTGINLTVLLKCKDVHWCSDPAATQMFTKQRNINNVPVFSHVWLFVTPRTIAHQAPPSMGFSRQEYWSGLPFPSLGDLNVYLETSSSQSPVSWTAFLYSFGAENIRWGWWGRRKGRQLEEKRGTIHEMSMSSCLHSLKQGLSASQHTHFPPHLLQLN